MIPVAAPKNIGNCLRGAPPDCACKCWFDLDVREFIGKLRRGGFGAAFSLYRNAVVFPGIVSLLCDAPCRESCVLKGCAGSIELRLLELAAVEFGCIAPPELNLPQKKGRVAVIGAGASGLACAVRLASKNYFVVVYERSESVGGELQELLPKDFLDEEIRRESMYAQYTLITGMEITSLSELMVDAVYISTGSQGADFGFSVSSSSELYMSTKPGVFLGGRLVGASGPAEAIAQGICAAKNIEAFLMSGGTCSEPSANPKSVPRPRVATTAAISTVIPASGGRYSSAEARLEASRCLRCDCDACFERCDLMQYYKLYPKKLATQVNATFNPDVFSPMNYSRMINSCTMCGGCREACPVDVDLETFLLGSRRLLQRESLVSPVFHEFWLRDMRHANSDICAFVRPAGGGGLAFFPGCQLGASMPEYVLSVYELLLGVDPGMGMVLHCCGAPAVWSGRDEDLDSATLSLRSAWDKAGRPKLITACPNCRKQLNRQLPEAGTASLYSFLSEQKIPASVVNELGKFLLFDPCAADGDTAVGVRVLLKKMGVDFSELSAEELGGCCGYGGGIGVANRALEKKISQKRISLSDLPYLTYCANCRDIFAAEGKESMHVIDLLCRTGRHPLERPTVSGRRLNRELLKEQLSKNYDPTSLVYTRESGIFLSIPLELRKLMDSERILEDDVRRTIELCEKSGSVIRRNADDMNIAHWRWGSVTYWVEYKKNGDLFTLSGVYGHRLIIEDANHE